MKLFNINKRHQRGYTRTHLLVVGLIGLAVASAVGIFLLVQSGWRGKEMGNNLLVLQASVRYINPQSRFPATLTEAVVIQAGRAPLKMISGNTLRAPWGGAVDIDGNIAYGGVTGGAFNITVYGAPRQICNDMVNTVAKQFQRIVVDSTTVKDESVGIVLDAATLTSACDADANDMIFTTAG